MRLYNVCVNFIRSSSNAAESRFVLSLDTWLVWLARQVPDGQAQRDCGEPVGQKSVVPDMNLPTAPECHTRGQQHQDASKLVHALILLRAGVLLQPVLTLLFICEPGLTRPPPQPIVKKEDSRKECPHVDASFARSGSNRLNAS